MDEQQRETDALEEVTHEQNGVPTSNKRSAEDGEDHVHGGSRQAVEGADGGSGSSSSAAHRGAAAAASAAGSVPHSAHAHSDSAPGVSSSSGKGCDGEGEKLQHHVGGLSEGLGLEGGLKGSSHVVIAADSGQNEVIEMDPDLKRLRDLGGVDGCEECL